MVRSDPFDPFEFRRLSLLGYLLICVIDHNRSSSENSVSELFPDVSCMHQLEELLPAIADLIFRPLPAEGQAMHLHASPES